MSSLLQQLDRERIHQHVTILAWLNIAGSGLLLLVGAFALFLLGGVGVAAGDAAAQRVLPLIGSLFCVFLALLALPGLLAGIGLLQRRNWGRILALVVAFLNLASFPLGTVLGLYAFWVLLQEEATVYFETPGRPAG